MKSADSFRMNHDHLYLFQEALAVAGEFREALSPSKEAFEEQYELWVDQMLQPEMINKDFWKASSRFSLLGALLSNQTKNLLKPQDFKFLIGEGSVHSEELSIDSNQISRRESVEKFLACETSLKKISSFILVFWRIERILRRLKI
jgi:hypothetical protein